MLLWLLLLLDVLVRALQRRMVHVVLTLLLLVVDHRRVGLHISGMLDVLLLLLLRGCASSVRSVWRTSAGLWRYMPQLRMRVLLTLTPYMRLLLLLHHILVLLLL